MSDQKPYTPDLESVQMHYEDGTIRMNPMHTIREATAEFDRFIARVKRDAWDEAATAAHHHGWMHDMRAHRLRSINPYREGVTP